MLTKAQSSWNVSCQMTDLAEDQLFATAHYLNLKLFIDAIPYIGGRLWVHASLR